MSVQLHKSGYSQAQRLVAQGEFEFDGWDDWSEHRPSTTEANRFIESQGLDHYGMRFLGAGTDEGDRTKGRYKFPYGDFKRPHRCGVVAAEVRGGQYKHLEIEQAAARLHGMIDGAEARRV